MSIGTLYSEILSYRLPLGLLLFVSPWVTYLACALIPGKREEPSLLSVNLALSTLSILMLVGYLAFALNTGGWAKVVNQADVILLVLPIYHVIASLYLAQLRLPLQRIPAFRTMQGLVMLGAAFFALSWVLSKIRIILFSYLPFGTFLGLMALLVVLGYVGYRKIVE